IAEFAKVGIFDADADGRTLWINQEGRELEELGPDEGLDDWRNHLDDSCREQYLLDWEAFVRQCAEAPVGVPRSPQEDEWHAEELYRTRDGGQRVLDVLVRATRGKAAALTGFVGVFKDITELKTTRQELDVSLESVSHNTKNAVRALEDVLDQLRHQAATSH